MPDTAAEIPAGEIPVPDEADAGPGLSDVGDQLLVAGAIEHDHHEVVHVAVEGPGDGLQVVRHRRQDVHPPAGGARHHQLLHVDVGRVEQSPPLGRGQDRDRTRGTGRAEVRALEGVDGDVHGGPAPGAHLLADVEHRRLVALALADDDGAVDVDGLHLVTHGFDGDVVRALPVALAHGPRGGDGGAFDDSHELERQIGRNHGHLAGRADHTAVGPGGGGVRSTPQNKNARHCRRRSGWPVPEMQDYEGGKPRALGFAQSPECWMTSRPASRPQPVAVGY